METFLFVLFLILKILGIILLVLIGLIALIMGCVLFVPFRYKGEGYYKNGEYDLRARVTFLLHILSVTYDINAEENLIIKVFGIKIKLKKEEKEEPQEISAPDGEGEITKPEGGETVETQPDEGGETTETETQPEPEKEPSPKKKKKKKKKGSKNKEVYDKIKEYVDFILSDEFRNTLLAFKKLIFSVIKIVLPKKWKAEGKVGFEDPYTNGQVCAVMGALYQFLNGHSTVYCDFEEPGIDVSGWFKGRIFVIMLLFAIIRLYLNKNVRKTIKFVLDKV